MSSAILLRTCLITMVLFSGAMAQGNPLFSGASQADPASARKKEMNPRSAIPGMKFLGPLLRYQKVMRTSLSRHLRELKNGFRFGSFSLIIAIAFLYGTIHALGPGHGKLVIGSYYLGQRVPLQSAWRTGSLFALTHTGVSALIFLVFYGVMQVANAHGQETSTAVIYRVSGILIGLFGAFLLYQAIRHRNLALHPHSHGPSDKGVTLVGIFAGLAPCPATLLVLVFTLRLGIMVYGIFAVLAIACGMALTATTVAAFTITLSRATILGLREKPWFTLAFNLMRGLGATIIIAIGIGMAW